VRGVKERRVGGTMMRGEIEQKEGEGRKRRKKREGPSEMSRKDSACHVRHPVL
jgi:hypothetical protein